MWDLHRKSANHKTLHFRPFLAKTNDSIFRKSPKTLFLPSLGPFCPKSREREFSQIWDLCKMLANNNTLHFRSFLAFWSLFGPFLPIFWKMRVFPKNWALSLLSPYGPLSSCKIYKKINEPIPRKLCYARTHART